MVCDRFSARCLHILRLQRNHHQRGIRRTHPKQNVAGSIKQSRSKKGDVFFIEPGTIHAIGGGSLIAEIQQNSNVTYRVYDYGRVGADGKEIL